MKVTKYPHRFTISLTELEFRALDICVERGRADVNDTGQMDHLDPQLKRILRSDRWQNIGGPLSVDVEKTGRGGQ